jgi:signal transduction histidine kinase
VILMRASMGEQAKTLEAATEALARITHQSHRMSATIDALLTFARAAAQPEPGARSDPGAVVQEVVADMRLLAGEARTEIVVEPLRAAAVACDPVVLGVVISNLVRNAVKYMGDGSRGVRRITLRGRRRGPRLRFEVEDTGPGLPPGCEARVFEPFVRLEETKHRQQGIGLGLATVKRLVEANGGEVGVESRPGVGCRFWFTLPLAP